MGALSDAGNIEGLGGNSGLDASLQGGLGGVIGAKGVQMGSGGLGGSGSGLGLENHGCRCDAHRDGVGVLFSVLESVGSGLNHGRSDAAMADEFLETFD